MPDSTEASETVAALQQRIAELTAENTDLRQQLVQLQGQLASH